MSSVKTDIPDSTDSQNTQRARPARGLTRARLTARMLHDELLDIGVPEDEVDRVDARVGSSGDAYVHLGDLSTSSADRLLAALCGRPLIHTGPLM